MAITRCAQYSIFDATTQCTLCERSKRVDVQLVGALSAKIKKNLCSFQSTFPNDWLKITTDSYIVSLRRACRTKVIGAFADILQRALRLRFILAWRCGPFSRWKYRAWGKPRDRRAQHQTCHVVRVISENSSAPSRPGLNTIHCTMYNVQCISRLP